MFARGEKKVGEGSPLPPFSAVCRVQNAEFRVTRNLVGTDVLGGPKTNACHKTNNQHVILSGENCVAVFHRECYICYGKPPKFVRRSLRRYAPCFHLVLHSVKVRQAQDDIQWLCLIWSFVFGRRNAIPYGEFYYIP